MAPSTLSLCLLAFFMAGSKAEKSSLPLVTQPILSTSTSTAISQSLSTSFYTYTTTTKVSAQNTGTGQGKFGSNNQGAQFSIITSTGSVVSSIAITEFVTIVNTIGSTTLSGPASAVSTFTSSLKSTSQTQETSRPQQTRSSDAVTLSATSTSASPALSTSSSSTTATKQKGSHGLSIGAKAGITLAVAAVAGGLLALFFVFIYRRARRDRGTSRLKSPHSSKNGDGKRDFSPEVGMDYGAKLGSKPESVFLKKEIYIPRQSVSPISRMSDNFSILEEDRRPISPILSQTRNPDSPVGENFAPTLSQTGNQESPVEETSALIFGRTRREEVLVEENPAPNFPQRNHSITALPQWPR